MLQAVRNVSAAADSTKQTQTLKVSVKPLIKAKPVFAAAQTFLRKASRLDRNFYMGALLLLCRAAAAVAIFGFAGYSGAPNKNKKENTQTKMAAAQKATAVFLLYKKIFDNAADAVKPLGEVGIELLIVFFVHFGAVIL